MAEFLELVNYLRGFNLASVCVRLVLTVLLSGIVGIERERHGKAAGLRTHILVCLGASMAAMTGLYIAHTYDADADITRIAAQVVSGIGFLGAGTILVRNKSTITGLTTAASIWATGALGLAIGYGFYEASILCAVFMLFIASQLGNIDRMISRRPREISIYAEFIDATRLNETLECFAKRGFRAVNVDLAEAKSNLPQGIGADIVIKLKKRLRTEDAIKAMNEIENVSFVIEA